MKQNFDDNELRRRLADAIEPILPRNAESRVLAHLFL